MTLNRFKVFIHLWLFLLPASSVKVSAQNASESENNFFLAGLNRDTPHGNIREYKLASDNILKKKKY
jgi:hypothetical protein